MPSLYVHLAPTAKIAAYEGDEDPKHHYAAALIDFGLWHKVETFGNVPGTDKTPEARSYRTVCGLEQTDRPDRMEESENDPGGERCPQCFVTRKGK